MLISPHLFARWRFGARRHPLSWQAPLAQTLDDLFGPLSCPLYAHAPSMKRTLLLPPQALQVLLRHIENIYLSQAVFNKTSDLDSRITNSPLCRPWESRYTPLRPLNRRHEQFNSPGNLAALRRV